MNAKVLKKSLKVNQFINYLFTECGSPVVYGNTWMQNGQYNSRGECKLSFDEMVLTGDLKVNVTFETAVSSFNVSVTIVLLSFDVSISKLFDLPCLKDDTEYSSLRPRLLKYRLKINYVAKINMLTCVNLYLYRKLRTNTFLGIN